MGSLALSNVECWYKAMYVINTENALKTGNRTTTKNTFFLHFSQQKKNNFIPRCNFLTDILSYKLSLSIHHNNNLL